MNNRKRSSSAMLQEAVSTETKQTAPEQPAKQSTVISYDPLAAHRHTAGSHARQAMVFRDLAKDVPGFEHICYQAAVNHLRQAQKHHKHAIALVTQRSQEDVSDEQAISLTTMTKGM